MRRRPRRRAANPDTQDDEHEGIPGQTPAETHYDRTRLVRVAAAVQHTMPWFTVCAAEAEPWADRWRIPVRVHPPGHGGPITVRAEHFAAVSAAGGTLVVEERFDPHQMNAFFVDVIPTWFHGWRAWSSRERIITVAAVTMACLSAATLAGVWQW